MLIALEVHPSGPRMRIASQRIHHGAIGCACAANGHKSVRFLGMLLMIHDRRDIRSWFRHGWQD